ncbi:hypothetical protein HMPREF9629_01926, partial [Peptoanaerobacter stomatis]
VELMNAGEKTIQPINEEIGSQLTKRLRKKIINVILILIL